MSKERIAILGGGVGAITTAFQLTEEPDWQARYDITVYQLGHRLGGKGASGRGPDGRIEEHGLHVWLGFYENAFRMIRKAYAELTPGGASTPITDGVFSSWEYAFRKHNWVGVFDHTALGTYQPWLIEFPENHLTPGDTRQLPNLWELTVNMLEWLAHSARHGSISALFRRDDSQDGSSLRADLERLIADLQLGVHVVTSSIGLSALQALAGLAKHLPPTPITNSSLVRDQIVALIEALRSWIVQEIGRHAPAERRLLLTLDMGATIVRGLVVDEVFAGKPLGALDDDFRAWLQHHGALPQTASLDTNPLLRALYDFVFAFVNGETKNLDASANFETSAAIRTIYRMLLTYSGAIFWKMNAGMGDTIFTPLYKVLKQRGVKFEFFSRVEQLHLSPDGRQIEAIEITRQATPVHAEYDPFVRVAGLDCWPSQPKYELLEQGQALRDQHVNLESFWSDWPGVGKLILRRGAATQGFERVVFGLSVGSVPFVASQLVDAHDSWRQLVKHVLTVRTMGVQWWLRPDLTQLGWHGPSVVSTAFAEPLDTWADMTHLLPRELWRGQQPGSLAYFCGALAGPPPDPHDRDTPARALAEVRDAVAALTPELRAIWPDAYDAHGKFERALLIAEYLRANVDPSERYVLSVAKSSRHRLKANATSVENLVITGDWIDNGFNAGCVEAAVMAGMQAANAVLDRDLLTGVVGRELS